MDFVTPIITPIVESLLVPIKRHLGFLVSSSNYVRDMHAKVRELNRAAGVIDTKRKANNANSLVIPDNVPEWLVEVEKIKAREDSIPTGGVGCFNIKMRYKAGKQSCDILKDIDNLMKEKNEMVWTDEIVPLAMVSPTRPTTSATVHDDSQNLNKNRIKFKSRDLIFNVVLKSLELNNSKNQKLALCGMGGVGKTTMMEQLEKAAKDMKMFDSIVKVNVGKNPNLIDVQKVIAEYTGKALTETTKDIRAARLEKRFKEISEEGKKKILVIMDDVWEELNLKDIGLTCPLPDGFKLLITSREETVCTHMGVEASSIFRIAVLEESEAKTLFWETAGIISHSDIDPGLHEIGEEIIKGCRGLPIAIKTIASTLRDNKEKYAWEDALFRLRNQEFHVLGIFEISYNNLVEDAKAIFLLSGLFPDDYNIDIEDLVRYGWGLNFFKNVHTLAQARNRVNTCVYNLMRSNLLIKSDHEGCVKMHDLVRDFVLSNISKIKQASIVNYDTNVYEQLIEDESYERILLKCEGMVEFPLDFKKPNLKFLKLMGDYYKRLKFPEDFYTRMETLEVAAYVNMHLRLLPQYSTKLRALSLRSCSLMYDISFLGDLINLEVLTLAHCGIQKLPSKLGKLKRLRLLDLTGCVDLYIDDGVFHNLEKLEELYMGVSNERAIRFTDANFDELKMLSRKLSALEVEFVKNNVQLEYVYFKRLERFRISMGCLLGTKLRLGKYSFKNTLKLVTSSMELLECKINELFRKTDVLYLEVNDMSYLQDVLMHPPKESFSNLKVLHVSRCASLTFLFNVHVAEGLKNLEILEVTSCHVLKSVVLGENMEGGGIKFNKLKILSLKDLRGLVSFCDSVNIMELPQLLELRLDELENFTSIFPENNTNISAKQSFLKKEDVIPKLEKLTISHMNNLKVIWPHEITSSEEEVNNISMLREITVESCHSMKNLFPSNPMRLLSHLEGLRIDNCDSIQVLFNIDLGKFEQLNSISNLRSIEVTMCMSFMEVWRIKDVENSYSGFLIRGFHAIESIYIKYCQKFRNLVTPIIPNFDMRALKDINIRSCGGFDERKNELTTNKQEHQIISHVSKEDMSNMGVLMSIVALPSFENTLNFHRLRNISFDEFQGMEVVFEIQSPRYRDIDVTTQQPLLLLPYLKTLYLSNMDMLSHVWKCSKWNDFFMLNKHQPDSSFQNLTTIYMRDCKSIKYLFSPLMVKLLSNLKYVEISRCDSMEDVISNRDDKDEEMMTSTLIHPTATLNTLRLYMLHNLKHIGGYESKVSQVNIFSWSFCQYSKGIYIESCDALESVIPSYAAEQMQNLQVLDVNWAKYMTEVFETKEISGSSNVDPASDNTVAIPRSKCVTTHKLPNLKILKIELCNCLENIITFSTFESLKNLEKLEIKHCKALKVIVREDYREQATTSTSKDVTFPHLKSIKLENLPKLASFFLGINIDFRWLLLDDVIINNCPQMIAFTSGRSTAPKLKYIHTELGKHQIPHQSIDDIISQWRTWSFHSLIECNLNNYNHHTNIFPSSELQQLQKLETVYARSCADLEEVFEIALGVENNYESQTVSFPKLREVELQGLNKLKYIWKRNQWRILEFPNLTRLSITWCRRIEHVFTYSMVGCVMQLQQLHINNCEKIKAIVKEEEDCDAKVCKIKFPGLKSVELDGLSSLEGFCLANEDITFPSLDTLEIKKCPRIMVFTKGRSIAPKLQIVETSLGSFNVGEDINSFIITKKQEGSSFGEIYASGEEYYMDHIRGSNSLVEFAGH